MEFRIDEVKRQVIVTIGAKEIILNELDTLNKIFMEGTAEKYECELVLQSVEINDENEEKTGITELKAFARRKCVESWLMEFFPEEYSW